MYIYMYIYVYICIYMYMYIYIYSNLGLDRISDIFNPGFQKNSWIIFKTTSFTFFSVPVMFGNFWTRLWRKNEREHFKKVD